MLCACSFAGTLSAEIGMFSGSLAMRDKLREEKKKGFAMLGCEFVRKLFLEETKTTWTWNHNVPCITKLQKSAMFSS